MFTAIIFKDGASPRNPVALSLPASRWDMLEAKAKLGVDSLNECSFKFEAPGGLPQAESVLKSMWRGNNHWNELNFFAQRVAEMDHSEHVLLGGAIAMHSPEDMKTLINQTYHLDNIVIGDTGSEVELGRFLVNNGMVEFPEEVIPYLDFAKIGHEHRANTICAFEKGMYFEDLSPEIVEVYDGRTLPEAPGKEHVFRVTISGYFPERSIDLLLPANEEEISEVMNELNTSYQSDISVLNAESSIALLNEAVRPFGRCAEDLGFGDLNELAHSISAMGDADYIKYLAVLEKNQVFAGEDMLDEMLECAMSLDAYDFTPGITAADIGSYGMIRQVGPVQELV